MDMLSKKLGVAISQVKFHSLVAQCEIAGQRCMLMKPTTYMNNSGRAVGECAKAYDIPAERVLVLTDDISLDVGVLRIRRKGSDGGQKGLRSIASHLGTEEYPRIKLGVGKKPSPEARTADWVLMEMNKSELDELKQVCEKACEAIELIVQDEIELAMGRYSK